MKEEMPIVSYDLLAHEYYEVDLHPTSNNFRTGSKQLFDSYFEMIPYKDGDHMVEAGAGKSLAAEWLTEHRYPLRQLLITDLHAAMLDYSAEYEKDGAQLAVCAGDRLDEQVSGQDWLVSSLGDPYNTASFWKSGYKLLRPGGHFIFTTPSFDWAKKFRSESQNNDETHAHFLMRDGRLVGVPSMIYGKDEQVRMAAQAGLRLVRYDDVYVDQIGSKISPKLFSKDDPSYPILTGYLFHKG